MRFCPVLPTTDFVDTLEYCSFRGNYPCTDCPYYTTKTAQHIAKWIKFRNKHMCFPYLRDVPVYITGERHR